MGIGLEELNVWGTPSRPRGAKVLNSGPLAHLVGIVARVAELYERFSETLGEPAKPREPGRSMPANGLRPVATGLRTLAALDGHSASPKRSPLSD